MYAGSGATETEGAELAEKGEAPPESVGRMVNESCSEANQIMTLHKMPYSHFKGINIKLQAVACVRLGLAMVCSPWIESARMH